jgi:hypothetical protein
MELSETAMASNAGIVIDKFDVDEATQRAIANSVRIGTKVSQSEEAKKLLFR